MSFHVILQEGNRLGCFSEQHAVPHNSCRKFLLLACQNGTPSGKLKPEKGPFKEEQQSRGSPYVVPR